MSNYSEPKVTIDLKEYNDLLEKVRVRDLDEGVRTVEISKAVFSDTMKSIPQTHQKFTMECMEQLYGIVITLDRTKNIWDFKLNSQ